jgi:hypothetical protein
MRYIITFLNTGNLFLFAVAAIGKGAIVKAGASRIQPATTQATWNFTNHHLHATDAIHGQRKLLFTLTPNLWHQAPQQLRK